MIATILHILAIATGIFVAIQGLKNIPFIAPLFVKYPAVAVILNAAGAFAASLTTCISGKVDFMCVITAIGVFVGAAGLHSVATVIGGSTTSPALKIGK
jgi:hypothetical protein